ncbi:MAG: tRNA (N6-isopentenyl adenosine(37)-C2)-methylthiotransferase MiaB [Planctomycetota bacterium]
MLPSDRPPRSAETPAGDPPISRFKPLPLAASEHRAATPAPLAIPSVLTPPVPTAPLADSLDDPTFGEGTARISADPEVCGDGLVMTAAGLRGAAPVDVAPDHARALPAADRATAQPGQPGQPASPGRVHMVVYGCQMNKADGELIGGLLAQRGWAFTPTPENADVILFETCSVRKQSEDRVFSALGNLKPWKQRNPAAVIGVLGCMAQKEGRAILARNPHVDLVVGTARLQDVPDLIEEIREGAPPLLATETGLGREADFTSVIPHRENRFQAWLPITRGCNKRCTYCVVPYTRGPESSLPMELIVEQVKRLVGDGVREITLLGQTIDTYGADLDDPRQNLANLLVKLDAIPDLWRIRFITSYPAKLSEDVFRAIADCQHVCEYAHMPVQSGSDRMLRRMKRGYQIATYRETVAAALKHVPHLTLATDVIVGFCGETEEDFQATRRLLEEIRFHTTYVFKYSPREGTPAMKLPDDVPQAVKEARNQELLTIQRAIVKEKQAAMRGTVQEVLVEGRDERNPALWLGRTRGNRTLAFSAGPLASPAAATSPALADGAKIPATAELTGCLASVKIHRSAAHLHSAELAGIVKR